jgi:endonuclease/exonuclease/phosphatase family metal-dependent hydrolase
MKDENLCYPLIDILLLQEVDVRSKRSAYIDQVQWLLDHTYFDYAPYASMWHAQVVPSDGLGRINTGQAVLSRWPILESERIQLPLRGDQDALTRYFYLRRCILKTRIALPGTGVFYALNVHLDAFSTDGTKKRQIDRVKEALDKLAGSGAIFVAGGDFNLIPPGSDSTDFCIEDKCPDESFHQRGDNPMHKEGSYFTPEATWLQELYDAYPPSVPIDNYLVDQERYYTGTAYTLPAGRWEVGLFQSLRHAWSESVELSTHPLAFFLIPNLSVKWSHGSRNGPRSIFPLCSRGCFGIKAERFNSAPDTD